MKKATLTTLMLTAALSAVSVQAQSKLESMAGMNMEKPVAGSAQVTHAATGVVKKINAKAGVVTLAHGPVNSLNWPPMTMGFKVKDKNLLAKLAVGKKVDFEFAQEGDDYVLTTVK